MSQQEEEEAKQAAAEEEAAARTGEDQCHWSAYDRRLHITVS